MAGGTAGHLSLVSQWFVLPGREAEAADAVTRLAADVEAHEPDTLAYLVHVPWAGDDGLQSLPPTDPRSLVFVEVYRDAAAFARHLDGPVFTAFVQRHGDLFVGSGGRPYTTVQFLSRRAGFVRGGDAAAAPAPGAAGTPAGNAHPAVMFEVIANDQAAAKDFYSQVFGWSYETGTGGFAYVHFPLAARPLLGGIGQADPSVPGFEPGHSFYLLVDDVEAAVARALSAGGTQHMPPTTVDGYRFAMICDPDGNTVGVIEPFAA